MQLKDGLISHLICLMYIPYFGKPEKPENHEFSLKLHLSSMLGS